MYPSRYSFAIGLTSKNKKKKKKRKKKKVYGRVRQQSDKDSVAIASATGRMMDGRQANRQIFNFGTIRVMCASPGAVWNRNVLKNDPAEEEETL